MKSKFFTSFTLAALLAGLAPLATAQNLAIVNGQAVPMARYTELSQQIERSGRKLTPELEKQIKEEVITREILLQAAKSQGLDNSQDFKAQLELARQSILIRDLFTTFQKTHPVSDAEVKAEYDKFVANNSGKEYHSHHILVDKEDEAKAIIARIKKGAKFEDIAKKSSKDPGSGAKGGDLGWASANNYVAEFAEGLTKLSKGQISDTPVKSQFGYHIIRLDDVREAKLPKLEEIKTQIAAQLERQKLVNYQQELRSKARIE